MGAGGGGRGYDWHTEEGVMKASGGKGRWCFDYAPKHSSYLRDSKHSKYRKPHHRFKKPLPLYVFATLLPDQMDILPSTVLCITSDFYTSLSH